MTALTQEQLSKINDCIKQKDFFQQTKTRFPFLDADRCKPIRLRRLYQAAVSNRNKASFQVKVNNAGTYDLEMQSNATWNPVIEISESDAHQILAYANSLKALSASQASTPILLTKPELEQIIEYIRAPSNRTFLDSVTFLAQAFDQVRLQAKKEIANDEIIDSDDYTFLLKLQRTEYSFTICHTTLNPTRVSVNANEIQRIWDNIQIQHQTPAPSNPSDQQPYNSSFADLSNEKSRDDEESRPKSDSIITHSECEQDQAQFCTTEEKPQSEKNLTDETKKPILKNLVKIWEEKIAVQEQSITITHPGTRKQITFAEEPFICAAKMKTKSTVTKKLTLQSILKKAPPQAVKASPFQGQEAPRDTRTNLSIATNERPSLTRQLTSLASVIGSITLFSKRNSAEKIKSVDKESNFQEREMSDSNSMCIADLPIADIPSTRERKNANSVITRARSNAMVCRN